MTRELKDAIAVVKSAEWLVRCVNDELAEAITKLKVARVVVAKLRRKQKSRP